MSMIQNILVTFVNSYSMDGGVSGCSVNYFLLDEDDQIKCSIDVKNAVGQQSAKANLAFEDRKKFVQVPGVYYGDFVLTTGSDRKPTLKLVDIKPNLDIPVPFCFPSLDGDYKGFLRRIPLEELTAAVEEVKKSSAGGDQKPGAKGTK